MQLSNVPRIGKVVPELDDEDIRELHLYYYRILYEIMTDHIHVRAVVHERQDLQPDSLN
ncbi:MAG: type II toxin-antitoxin system RelE/ParE family toxin [Pseudomonadota bacterium]